MVATHYRWDFVGLSTDTKPTPETSEKVVDGSTYYCSDTSKLYVYCKDNWYERKSLGGGGGGTTYTAGDGINITSDVISVDQTTIQGKLTAGSNISISGNTISATDTTDFTELTDDDANYNLNDTSYIAAWLLPSGKYKLAEDATVEILINVEDDGGTPSAGTSFSGDSEVMLLSAHTDDTSYIAEISVYASITTAHYSVDQDGVLNETAEIFYSDFTGTDGNTAGEAGLVPAPLTTDAGKFLKADGTWDTAGGSVTPVQTPGVSTTDIMSQNAVTSMVFDDPGTRNKVKIGSSDDQMGSLATAISVGSLARGEGSIAIGQTAYIYASGLYSVAIGNAAKTENHSRAVALGNAANAAYDNSVAIGTNAITGRIGEVNVGAGTSGRGYNSTNYRVIGGVHDGQGLHDAATVAQGNTLSTSAPTTSTVGVLGQLWTDTTNMHTYQCTAISGDTYTWTQRW